ncbi:sulfurtransferase [Sutcliffiella rhizosphaerae]|uniref:Thiosulfate sulfurtransferase SseB n=1 Tax=Sutcliffiella rhizosphaerae TaxID=2880967 RepID=A0ABM8YUN6_9BACI|nr:sulfurtransferase [Sutcliffiella rhizosphaerae]CAG9623690.1 Putative thiosulfate sulfurtransferase SseB [Sutcliffiella rhizosphaerae]
MKYIVQPEWVNEHLESLVILDCRFYLQEPDKGFEEYKQSHLPNAYYFDLNRDLSGPVQKHGGRHPLPNIKEFHLKLEEAGVHDNAKVLLYDDQNGAMASRMWFLLQLVGFHNVYIMDGGYSYWKELRFPLTNHIQQPTQKSGKLTVKFNEKLIVGKEEVKASLPDFELDERYLLDAREPKRFTGEEEPIDRIAGHIPGARNAFWLDNTENGKWKDEQDLKKRFQFLDKQKEVVVYCGSGVTACPTILALKVSGFVDIKLYAGSWSDWISYADNPISKSTN